MGNNVEVKVKSPYGSERQRGVKIKLIVDGKVDAAGYKYGIVYDGTMVDRMYAIKITDPSIEQCVRESNFLVQFEPKGKWYEAFFNGRRLSWKEEQ